MLEKKKSLKIPNVCFYDEIYMGLLKLCFIVYFNLEFLKYYFHDEMYIRLLKWLFILYYNLVLFLLPVFHDEMYIGVLKLLYMGLFYSCSMLGV